MTAAVAFVAILLVVLGWQALRGNSCIVCGGLYDDDAAKHDRCVCLDSPNKETPA